MEDVKTGMKMMKLLPVLLAAAIVMTAAAGCGSRDDSQAVKETEAGAAVTSSPAANPAGGAVDGSGEEDGAGNADAANGADKAGATDKTETEDKTKDTNPSGQTGEGGAEEAYSRIPEPPASDGSKILFVGNSHTYTNDLPGMFYSMAEAGGHKVDVYDLTEGYYTLKMYSDPEDELGSVLTEALKGESWDFVVLQENTNASIALNAKKDMYPYARQLDGMIQKAGGQTVFLMTWAPKDGAGVLSHEMVQTQLSLGYRTIAEELDALLIPGGEVFEAARKQAEGLELWGEDGQHPSEEGTYLAACSAYALLFQESPVGNSFVSDLDQAVAGELQEIADAYILGTKKS